MAKIADYTSLERRIPTGRAPVARLDTRGVGAGYEATAGILSEQAERITKNQIAKADVDMSIALTNAVNELDQDPDYQTHGERYTGAIEGRLGEIAATIQDGNARNAFVQAYRPKIAVGAEKVKAKAWGKEREFEQGEMTRRIDAVRDEAIVSGDIIGANTRIATLIDSARDLGHIDADVAAGTKIKFRDQLAEGRIKYLPPEQRVEALKKPWAKKHLDPDVHARLLREAEADAVLGKAQATVDGLGGMTYAERRDVIAQIDNPLERQAAEAYNDKVEARDNAERNEQRGNIFKGSLDAVRGGADPKNTMTPVEWKALTVDQQLSLHKISDAANKPSPTPYNLHYEIQLQALNGNPVAQAELFYRISGELGTGGAGGGQAGRWAGIVGKELTPRTTNLNGALKYATTQADALGFADDEKALIHQKIIEWDNTLERSPTKKEMEDFVKGLFIKEDIPGEVWGTNRQYSGLVTDDQRVDLIREKDSDGFNKLMDRYDSEGIKPSPSLFLEDYHRPSTAAPTTMVPPKMVDQPASELTPAPLDAMGREKTAAAQYLEKSKAKREARLKGARSIYAESRVFDILLGPTWRWYQEATARGHEVVTARIEADARRREENRPIGWEEFVSMSEQEIDAFLDKLKERDSDRYESAVNKYLSVGHTPTDWQIIEAYEDAD